MAQDQVIGIKLWLVLAVMCILGAGLFISAGFCFSEPILAARIKIPLIGTLIGWLFMQFGQTRRFGSAIEGTYQMSIVALAGVMGCYLAAIHDAPLIDARLLGFDRSIGYDWFAYAQFCAGHPMFFKILRFSYYSAYFQPALIALILHLSEKRARYETFVLAMMISLMITVIIFLFFPATTAWTYLHQEGLAHRTLASLPLSSGSWVTELLRLRHGGSRFITGTKGLVAFPSYHCVMALTFVWAIWPMKLLRPFSVAINAATIASAPIFGGHYIADLVAGGAVAFVGIASAKRGHEWLRGVRLPAMRFPLRQPAAARTAVRVATERFVGRRAGISAGRYDELPVSQDRTAA